MILRKKVSALLVTIMFMTLLVNVTGLLGQSGAQAAEVGSQKFLSKDSTNYDAATQTISWAIKYNYNQKDVPAADAILTDLFPDTQQLVPNSLQVYPITFNSGGFEVKGTVLASSEYTVTPTTAAGQTGFHVQFHQDVTSAFKIEYKTAAVQRVTGTTMVINSVYSNTYKDVSGREIDQVIISKRAGAVDAAAQTVVWTVKLNGDSKIMSNVYLQDTFTQGGLQFVPGSLTVTADGGAPAAYNLVLRESVTPAATDGFDLTLQSPISGPHTVSYATYFDEDWLSGPVVPGNVEYVNQARVDWDENGSAPLTVTAAFDPSGANGKLTIQKVDEADPSLLLSGASFELYRVSDAERTLVNTLTTDSVGKAVFKKLITGAYVLIEKTAPAGYKLDPTEHLFTIDVSATTCYCKTITNAKLPPTDPPPTDPPPTDPPPTNPPPTDPPPTNPPPTDPPPTNPPPTDPPTTNPPPTNPPTDPPTTVPPTTIPPTTVPPIELTPVPDVTPTGNIEVPTEPVRVDPPEDVDIIETDVDVPLGTAVPDETIAPMLPKTGEASPWKTQALGVAVILLGFAVLRRKVLVKR
ncbi:hypothetical protein SY83_05145 [Paenibacillus swuensis]|uniref:Gram-positive cocci surface proteins LPxTG domain-containing protein n=1 Tax=Paenibacillus swuensis TaxID=1178515 RepID=A0A172TFE6_9BACL|nr:collagen binding domain-containing protein [Paenibacillus swuensis]ANE45785.1 hypothetical protein SY83_05145 [Paenibacillus swuensis]